MARTKQKTVPKKQLLTPEQWKQFEESIRMYSMGYVLIDGIPFSFLETRYKNKIVITFYIANWKYGKWVLKDHRFCKYFLEKESWLLKKKDRDSSYRFWKRLEGKKYADMWLEQQKYTYRSSTFGSFRTLKSHLNKVVESIEIIDKERYNSLSNAYRQKYPEDFSRE